MKGKLRYQIWLTLGISYLFVILPCAGYGADLSIGNTTVSTSGNLTVGGTITATSFSGDGSGLTGVEKRTAISACGTISQSGSYYVTQNLSTTGTCITVTANDVTIDLNGFTLTGDGSGSSDYGVHINNVSNVEVKNGTVRSFSRGIYAYWSGTATRSNRAINVRAVENGWGIFFQSYNNLIKDSSAVDSTVGYGISASLGSTLMNNIASGNQGVGISAGSGSTVTHNTASDNQESGIYAINASTVTHNTAYSNNQSNGEKFAGIYVGAGCLVKNNTIRSNLQNNIYVFSSDNAMEKNLVTDSLNGIQFAAAGNFYANNRARSNTTNYNTGGLAQTDGGGNVGF